MALNKYTHMKTYVTLIRGVYSMLFASLTLGPMRYMIDLMSGETDLGLFKVFIIIGVLAWPFLVARVTTQANRTIWSLETKNFDAS